MSKRKIGIIGARGIANYGGFETLVAELAPRLHRRGFQVYCSHRMREEGSPAPDSGGVNVMYFPFRFPRNNLAARIFEILYDGYFLFKCAFVLRCKVVYCLGALSGFMLFGVRLSRAKIVLNLDGVEWRRQKFNFAERGFVKVSFLASSVAADRLVIDNRRLSDYVNPRFQDKVSFIPYGVNPVDCSQWDPSVVDPFTSATGAPLNPGSYWLVVARLEPDNNIHVIVDAYLNGRSEAPLVIVGGFSSPGFERRIKRMIDASAKGRKVVFTGPIFDRRALQMLRCHCMAYLHGHSVGGTNPSLLEAMGAGNVIVAHDNVFNREVCRDAAFYFDSASGLSVIMDEINADTSRLIPMKTVVKDRAHSEYQWDGVADLYVEMVDGL